MYPDSACKKNVFKNSKKHRQHAAALRSRSSSSRQLGLGEGEQSGGATWPSSPRQQPLKAALQRHLSGSRWSPTSSFNGVGASSSGSQSPLQYKSALKRLTYDERNRDVLVTRIASCSALSCASQLRVHAADGKSLRSTAWCAACCAIFREL